MSGTSSVNNESGNLSLVDLLYEARKDSGSSILGTSTTLESSNNTLSAAQNKKTQKANTAYGGGLSSTLGQAAVKRALSEMNSSGKVTFKDIAEHRDKLETEFSASVRVDLAKLGVSMDTEFSLNMTPEGQVYVVCDDPIAKEKIQKYLEENPKACEQFGYIQALSNLERARQSPAGSLEAWQGIQNSVSSMQTQALEAFFGDALNTGMSYSSILANFGAGDGSTSTSFYAGVDFTV